MNQELGHIKADTASAYDSNTLTDRLSLKQGVDVTNHFRVVDTLNFRDTRLDACRQDNFVEPALFQHVRISAHAQPDVDTQFVQHDPVIPKGLVELLLARNAFSQVKLATYLISGVNQRHLVATLGGGRSKRQAGRTCADYREFLGCPAGV